MSELKCNVEACPYYLDGACDMIDDGDPKNCQLYKAWNTRVLTEDVVEGIIRRLEYIGIDDNTRISKYALNHFKEILMQLVKGKEDE